MGLVQAALLVFINVARIELTVEGFDFNIT